MTIFAKRACFSGTALYAFVMAGVWPPAFAQTGAPGTLEEIVVTARKRTESLHNVPISAQVVDQERLDSKNVVKVEDLAVYVPNFSQSIGAGSGGFKYIRGLGSGSNLSFEQAVGTFTDNVYTGRNQEGRLPFFDLERLEVLMGPQVLVFGDSATAGAINLTTKKPGTGFEADGTVSYEGINREILFRGGVTIPVSDSLRIRLAGLKQNLDEGWLRNTATGTDDPRYDNYGARITALYEPTDDLQITLKYERTDVDNDGTVLQPIHQNFSGAPLYPETDFDDHIVSSNAGAPFFDRPFVTMITDTYQGTLAYQLFGGTLTATTALHQYDFANSDDGDMAPVQIFNFFQNEQYKQFTQELRYSNTAGPVDYEFGAYFRHDRIEAFSLTDVNPPALGLPLPPFGRFSTFDEASDAYSGFVNLTYNVTEALRASAGVRYTEISRTADQAVNPANVIPGINRNTDLATASAARNPAYGAFYPALFGNAHTFTDIEVEQDFYQPQFVVQYEVNPDVNLFAKWVRGSKAGGVDWLYAFADPAQAVFRPEVATSTEIGAKTKLLDNRLNVDVTLFHTVVDDLQVSIFNGSTNFLVTNAAKTEQNGVELGVRWRPIEQLTIETNAAYLDASYGSFANAACTADQKRVSGPLCRQDLSGAPTSFSPKFAGALEVTYEQPIGEYYLTGGVGVQARSSYNASTNNDPLAVQSAYALFDARLEFAPQDGRWSVALFGRNLGDKLYLPLVADTPAITGSRFVSTPRGRQVGVQFGANF